MNAPAPRERPQKRLRALRNLGDRGARSLDADDLDPAPAQNELFRRRLQHFAGDLEQLAADLDGGGAAGRPEGDGRAAAAHADVVASRVRVGLAHDHVVWAEAKLGRHDLRHGLHHRAGADFDAGGDDGSAAVRIEIDCRRGRADEHEPRADGGRAAIEPLARPQACGTAGTRGSPPSCRAWARARRPRRPAPSRRRRRFPERCDGGIPGGPCRCGRRFRRCAVRARKCCRRRCRRERRRWAPYWCRRRG